MVDCTDKLLGKRVSRKSSILSSRDLSATPVSIETLKKRLLLRVLEDVDDPSNLSIGDIIRCLDLYYRHHGLQNKDKDLKDFIKTVYLSILNNYYHLLTDPQAEHFHDIFQKIAD